MMLFILLLKKQMVLCVMLCLFFDRVVSYCGTNLTRQAVTENLNVLDYETYITVTDLILENKIPDY
jgi:hypothetical protein